MEQKSSQWYESRRGKLTSSFVYFAVAKQKNGRYFPKRVNIMQRLKREQQGCPIKQYTYRSAAQKWGVEQESHAILAYQAIMHLQVTPCTFIPHPVIANCGATPDGLVGDQGVLEVKCPQSQTHQSRLNLSRQGKNWWSIENCYQMTLHMMCAQRKWCDFVSYDPRFPQETQILIGRYYLDDDLVDYIEQEIYLLNQQLSKM